MSDKDDNDVIQLLYMFDFQFDKYNRKELVDEDWWMQWQWKWKQWEMLHDNVDRLLDVAELDLMYNNDRYTFQHVTKLMIELKND